MNTNQPATCRWTATADLECINYGNKSDTQIRFESPLLKEASIYPNIGKLTIGKCLNSDNNDPKYFVQSNHMSYIQDQNNNAKSK